MAEARTKKEESIDGYSKGKGETDDGERAARSEPGPGRRGHSPAQLSNTVFFFL